MLQAVLHTGDQPRAIAHNMWLTEISARRYDGIIFDCDGTLVESAEVHLSAFQAAAAAQGHAMARDWYLARTGLDRRSLFVEFETAHPGFDVNAAVAQSVDEFIARSDQVRVIQETRTLAEALGATLPLAVGTNAEGAVARASLTAVGMIDLFDHIVSFADGHPPKPSPAIFTAAAGLLGVAPDAALVVEDSPQGVRAGKAAGMDVLELREV